jgi:hypothetical protein
MEGIMEILREMQAALEATPPEKKAELMAKWNSMANAWLGESQEALKGVIKMEEEPAPEETEVVAETEEFSEGATGEEAIGTAKERSRDRRLAVRCRGLLKTRTKCDGRVRQDCAPTVGRPTRRFVPALRKGGLHRGPGKKCRSGTGGQKCRRSGIKDLGKTSGSRVESRSLKQRRPEYNVVRGTAKGKTCEERRRTRLECNDGIRGRGARQHRRLERKKTHSEAIRQKLDVKIAKFIFESYIRLWEPGDWLLWKCQPPPKRKR